MSNGKLPFGLGDWQDSEAYRQFRSNLPKSAQDWVDQATGQGTPPDYQPPAVPGDSYTIPQAPPPAPGRTPQQQAPGQFPGQSGPDINIIDTSSGRSDGLNKCPRCGSTEVSLRVGSGMLVCHFCRHEWNEASLEQQFGLDTDISQLRGTTIASGAGNIQESTKDVLTLKCQACGSEVIVNTAEALQSRCHWCRQTLSVNTQIPNGAVPDGLLPFKVPREQAIASIDEFVKKRRFFAHPTFVKEFAPTEVVGVYLPFVTIDANAHVTYEGHGEILRRSYMVKRGDRQVQLYDADVFHLGRAFDLHVDDIMIESSGARADQDTSKNTNNIINAILPFDVKEAVAYNANYLRGYTSERRDREVDHMGGDASERVLSIGRNRANELTTQYNRGVRWETETLQLQGTRWVSLYVPVWLYSYYQTKGSGAGLTHYVAVNGRTGTTMGSVPVRQGRLIGISTVIGIVGTIIGGTLAWLAIS